MTKYIVTITVEGDYLDIPDAACQVYRKLYGQLASPNRGAINASVTNVSTGNVEVMSLFDGVLEADPLFAAQLIGIRHLVWGRENPPRQLRG